MNKGMAIPYPEEGTARTAVMTFISAQGTPIARRFELWTLDPAREAMTLGGGDDATAAAEDGGTTAVAVAPVTRGVGLVGRAWSRCAPLVEEASGSASAAVAIPFFQGARVTAVVAWHF